MKPMAFSLSIIPHFLNIAIKKSKAPRPVERGLYLVFLWLLRNVLKQAHDYREQNATDRINVIGERIHKKVASAIRPAVPSL